MNDVNPVYPEFEKGSPSGYYQQISNFTINYLDGMLVNLIHLDVPENLADQTIEVRELQDRLHKRERTVRHAYQFQIEKRFNNFKSIRRTRLHTNQSSDLMALGVAGHRSSQILRIIEQISERLEDNLGGLIKAQNIRLKSLVHRTDKETNDNPIAPSTLCEAFVASVETLGLTVNKIRLLLQLYEALLDNQLEGFYVQLDLGMYNLDVLPELTDPSRFIIPDDDDVTMIKPLADVDTDYQMESEQATAPVLEQVIDNHPVQELVEELPDNLSETPTEDEQIPSVNETPQQSNEALEATVQAELAEQEAEKPEAAEESEGYNTAAAETPLTEASEIANTAEILDSSEPDLEPAEIVTQPEQENFGLVSIDDTAALTESLDEGLPDLQPLPIEPTAEQLVLNSVDIVSPQLLQLKQNTVAGTGEFKQVFKQFIKDVTPQLSNKELKELNKFIHYYSRLLGNALLSDPLRLQLSRLAAPLTELVIIDPFFFRSSSHPVNDFIQSVIDFEIRSKHQEKSLSLITSVIDRLLAIDHPRLNDYQPLIQEYESYKEENLEAITLERWQKEQDEKKLEGRILKIINQMTDDLVVDTETLSFFYDDWQLLLTQLARKIGFQSTEFKQAREIGDILSYMLSQRKNPDLEKYDRYPYPSLLRAIDKGLRSMNYSSQHRNRVRKQLVKEYRKLQAKLEITVKSGSSNSSNTQFQTDFKGLFTNRTSQLSDLTSATRRQAAKKKSKYDIDIGTWVVIKDKSGAFKPAKLNWKSNDCSLYLFINQRGHVTKEFNLQQLDQAFREGNVKILKSSVATESRSQSTLGSGFTHFK